MNVTEKENVLKNEKDTNKINLTNLKDFEIEQELNSNNEYIKIFKVLRKIDNKHYILLKYPLNIITNDINSFQKLEKILETIKIFLKKINHSNIINIKESFIEKSKSSVVMILELYDNVTIQNTITKYKLMRDRYIPESLLLDYLSNIIEGLSVLHKNNIFNINICPQNIYINENIIKLNPYISLENLSSSKISNNEYFKVIAPELKNNKNYTSKTDIWYLGLLIYEITQLKSIDRDYFGNKDDIYNYIIRTNYTFNNYYSNDIKELIKLCLHYTPNKRPSTNELLKIIEIYKKNKILNNKINSMKNTKKSYNLKRKINLKDEIVKINQTLAKIKNYNNKNKSNKIHRDLTPVLTRKNSNFNLNVNAKNFLFKNSEIDNKQNYKRLKKQKLKLKTSFINNLYNNNYEYKTGKKFFGIHKNNETLKGYLKTKPFDIKTFISKNPIYFQYEKNRNKTPDNFWRVEKNSIILINSYENSSLWKEAKYRKLNEYIIKEKNNNLYKNNFKRANSINYYKKNKIIEKNEKNNKINSGKLKVRNISPFNKKNKKISNSFYLPYRKV